MTIASSTNRRRTTHAAIALALLVSALPTAAATRAARTLAHRPSLPLHIDPATHECAVRSMRCGQNVSGVTTIYGCRLDSGHYYSLYRFSTSSNYYVNVDAVAGFTPIVGLYDDDLNLLALAGDGKTSRVQLRNFRVPATGSYHVLVGSYDAGEVGGFSVTVRCSPQPEDEPGADECRPSASFTNAGSATGSLTPSDACSTSSSYYDLYTFFGEAGKPVEITYTAAGYRPYIEVNVGAENSGMWRAGDTGVPMSFLFYPEVTGEHHIWLGSYTDTPASGTYSLSIAPIEDAACKRRAIRH